VASVAAVTLIGCTGGQADSARMLPAERSASLLYVALGDSTVEGVAATSRNRNYVSLIHERLRAVYPAARVENLGRGGAVSADVVDRQLSRAIGLEPDLVTLSIGPNDITTGVSVETYDKNVETIFRRLTRETNAVIVVNLLPDLTVTPRFRFSERRAALDDLTRRFNQALETRARERGIDVVDLYGPSREEVPGRPELIAADGYHPSDLGYARWAELMWKSIAPRVTPR
jgi:lysophospholipase L1-like esterase